ncbi:MAG: nickel pincer cofactor biosynthesis protein LarB [Planctomycetaceae bacterium]|nr:nickel pincer cofactor biosynthesis protein LarB [Planctomycetaceae bacterium]
MNSDQSGNHSVTAPDTAITDSARVDLDRRRRCGFPEVVYCEGKTVEAVEQIFAALVFAGQEAFGTRASTDQAAAILRNFPHAKHNAIAHTIRVAVAAERPPIGKVAVVTAGTSDRPVAEEALETLRWMGCAVERIEDVGVAGPQRLLAVVPQLQDCDAVVVVAGMEGALPSVVGGHVACPVIAVPTSVGYGASFGGIAALLGMLNSCAANVAVVNIDAGFKAGYVAGLIAKQKADLRSEV